MANLTVISTTAVPDHVRGALSRWMLEPTPGLYVGTLSGKVRDELWAVVAASVGTGAAVVISPSDNEQRFIIRTAGERRRTVEDFDGLMMIVLNPLEADNESTKAV